MPFDHLAPTTLIVGALIVLGLIALVRLTAKPRAALPYRRKTVLSPWERKALPGLLRQLPAGTHLCPQVRLADLLAITAGDPSARQTALNRVACKSVDFVVVDLASGDALLVVELDDRSHARPDRQARDAFVNEVLRVAGVPVARFRPGQAIDLRPHLPTRSLTGKDPFAARKDTSLASGTASVADNQRRLARP